jgi:hypothetical protein
MKRTILIVIVVLIAAGGVIGYRMFHEATPDIVSAKPDQAVSVAALIAAFEKDTAAAANTYIDRIVEVTGMVKSADSSGTIVLGTEDSESAVSCGLDRRHIQDYKGLSKGQLVVVQGRCSGYSHASGDDLLSALGTTVELSFAGLKRKN